ncbi:unnamed protein product, partial [Brenthis ino]
MLLQNSKIIHCSAITLILRSITTNASNIESQDALIKSIIKLRGCTKVAVIKSSTKMLCRKEFFLFSYVLYLGVYGASDTQKAGNERSIFNGASIEDVLNFKINIDDYCDEDNYKKGDFTSPKRRISEVKCLDYIWTTRYKQFEFDRSECIKEIVIGGRPAFYGEFPHMGALGWRSTSKENEWEFKCGASLISERFMLTAAHCTYVSTRYGTVANHQPEIVKLGDKFLINSYPEEQERRKYENFNDIVSDIEKNRMLVLADIPDHLKPKYVRISRIIKHEKYRAPKVYFDIALLELAESVDIGPLIRPACLWGNSDTSSLGMVTLSVTGWGVVDTVTRKAATELQVADVDVIDDSLCDAKLNEKHNRNWGGLVDHQICAGQLAGGIDTCQGDSGGPLQSKINLTQSWDMYYLVGVTSFGFSCARPDVPSIYTKTASFIDWIESIVWPDS